MYQQRQASSGNMRQCRSQLLLRNHREAVNTGVDQKAFESWHSFGRERFDITLVIVNYTAPRGPVNAASALRSRTLGLKRADRSCCRKTIQRHIDQQCVTACGRGPRRCLETLPLAPPRIVNMNMGIDQSWKDSGFAEVMDFITIGYLIGRNDRLNLLPVNQDGRGTHSFRRNHSSSEKGLQAQIGSFEHRRRQHADRVNHSLYNARSAGLKRYFTKFRAPAYTRCLAQRLRRSRSTDLRVRGLLKQTSPWLYASIDPTHGQSFHGARHPTLD